MIQHNYTLKKITEDLNKLIGFRLSACFAQEKEALVLEFQSGDEVNYIQIFTGPNLSTLFLRNEFSRARKNSINLFPELTDEVLQDVSLLPNDRIITLSFIHSELHIHLFGGAQSNVFAVNSDNIIINTFTGTSQYKGNEYFVPENKLLKPEDVPLENSISTLLKNSTLLMGKHYADEYLKQINTGPDKKLSEFTEKELKDIIAGAFEFRDRILNSQKYYVLETSKKKALLSLIPLSNSPHVINVYGRISDAVYYRVVHYLKYSKYFSLYKQLSSQYTKLEKKLTNNIKITEDGSKSLERAENYQLWGELLASQPNPKLKPGDSIDIYDWEGNELKIQLDPKLNLIDNSAKYFQKSKKAKESVIQRQKQLPQLKQRLKEVKQKIMEIEKAKTASELEKIRQASKNIHGVQMKEIKKEQSDKFRQFDLGEGFVLYVGKSAKDNDELTMKFASPNDLWFHARGAQGSHCVIKLEKNQKAPKYIIKKAAAIAAHYSKAKNAKYAPVAYTYKKYVRKPKGANTGSVVISREEVVMVEPGLPEGALD